MDAGLAIQDPPETGFSGVSEPTSALQAASSPAPAESSGTPLSSEAHSEAGAAKSPTQPRSRSISPSKKKNGPGWVQRKLGKEEMQAMAERLSRVETKEKKEQKAHPMQLKYEYDSKSRKFTETYIRAKKVTSEAQTEYLKALADRCVTKQQQTEEALRQKYLKPLNPNAKKVTKADMEEHMARVQRLFQGQGAVDRPAKLSS